MNNSHHRIPHSHNLLTPLQQEFLNIFTLIPDQNEFYLTGGTALSEYYLGYRLSYDLDLFTGVDGLVQPVSFQLEKLTSPAPDPLPARVYASRTTILTIVRQFLSSREALPQSSTILENGQFETENEYFELTLQDSYLPVDLSWWQEESARAAQYVSARMNVPVSGQARVVFLPPRSGNCAARGTSFR